MEYPTIYLLNHRRSNTIELKYLLVMVAGILANIVFAKLLENDRLKKQNKKLKQKLGMENN